MTSILRANDDSIQSLGEQFLMAGEPGHAELFAKCSSFIRVFMRESDEFDSRNRFEISLIPCGMQVSDTENSDAHKIQISPQRHRGHEDWKPMKNQERWAAPRPPLFVFFAQFRFCPIGEVMRG